MLKTILNLNGAHELNKREQKAINGGGGKACCDPELDCCIPHAPCDPVPNACGAWGDPCCNYLFSAGFCCV